MENSLYLVKEPNTHLKDCYFNFCGYSKQNRDIVLDQLFESIT